MTRRLPPYSFDVENPSLLDVSRGYRKGTTEQFVDEGPTKKRGQKRGHTLFGCFCDTRRAVLICNSLNLIYSVVVLALIYADVDFYVKYGEDEYVHDDIVRKEVMTLAEDNGVSIKFIAAGFAGATVFFAALGIYGALDFRSLAVFLTIIWYMTTTLINAFLVDPIGTGIGILLLYPHILLSAELSYGIMTRKNYQRREQSCCCGQ